MSRVYEIVLAIIYLQSSAKKMDYCLIKIHHIVTLVVRNALISSFFSSLRLVKHLLLLCIIVVAEAVGCHSPPQEYMLH